MVKPLKWIYFAQAKVSTLGDCSQTLVSGHGAKKGALKILDPRKHGKRGLENITTNFGPVKLSLYDFHG